MPKTIPEVLIVENQRGNVYIVECKGEAAKMDKILKNSEKKIKFVD